jgi:hypothetical protein
MQMFLVGYGVGGYLYEIGGPGVLDGISCASPLKIRGLLEYYSRDFVLLISNLP